MTVYIYRGFVSNPNRFSVDEPKIGDTYVSKEFPDGTPWEKVEEELAHFRFEDDLCWQRRGTPDELDELI